jgi:hypothetical protein
VPIGDAVHRNQQEKPIYGQHTPKATATNFPPAAEGKKPPQFKKLQKKERGHPKLRIIALLIVGNQGVKPASHKSRKQVSSLFSLEKYRFLVCKAIQSQLKLRIFTFFVVVLKI